MNLNDSHEHVRKPRSIASLAQVALPLGNNIKEDTLRGPSLGWGGPDYAQMTDLPFLLHLLPMPGARKLSQFGSNFQHF
jgi:hypothetical protein